MLTTVCAIFWISCLMTSSAEKTVEEISVFEVDGPPEIAPKGDEGRRGLKGFPGLMGEMGEKGKSGPKGKAGHDIIKVRERDTSETPGDTKSKTCNYSDSVSNNVFKNCKWIPEEDEDGKYCISPIDSVISAKCDSLSTCIGAKDISSSYIELNSIKYTSEDDTFWLSKLMKGTDLSYDIPMDALYGLQIQSIYVIQVIVIHCRNSFVYFNGINYDNAVQLLTWNDVVIGPYPTETSPLYYTVDPSLDECQYNANDGTWKQTTIELRSSNTFRLPIKDVLVKDIHAGNKEIFVELKDLCFM